MRITISAVGSRGDVQPYVALGEGLARAGHAVRLATHAEFASLVEGRGMEYFRLVANPRDLMDTDTADAMLQGGANPLFLRHLATLAEGIIVTTMRETLTAMEGADLVVASTVSMMLGPEFARDIGLPTVAALLGPYVPTAHMPSPAGAPPPDWLPAKGLYNRLSHHLALRFMRSFFGEVVRKARLEVADLLPVRGGPIPLLPTVVGVSPTVVPTPPDWPAHVRMTGYWFLDAPSDWRPPADLQAFLDAGPPPVYIGFGSMRTRDPELVTSTVIDALARAGQRGVLYAGWARLGEDGALPPHVCLTQGVPHAWLFPRCAAVVTHGGAGTTAAALRAGVPTIVTPFFADQPFWAWRVHKLGAGPAPVSFHRLTTANLAKAITTALTDVSIGDHAAEIGRRIRAEDGVGAAVRVIEGAGR